MCFMCDIKKRMAGGGGDAEGGFQFPGPLGLEDMHQLAPAVRVR